MRTHTDSIIHFDLTMKIGILGNQESKCYYDLFNYKSILFPDFMYIQRKIHVSHQQFVL